MHRQIRDATKRKKKHDPGHDDAEPGSRTGLSDKGTRMLSVAEANQRKRKAEEKLMAEREKQERLEAKRLEKALLDSAMGTDRPEGALISDVSDAPKGQSEVTIGLTVGWRVGVLKPVPLAPIEKLQLPPTGEPLRKAEKVAAGLAHGGKVENMGYWQYDLAERADEWTFVHISFPNSVL